MKVVVKNCIIGDIEINEAQLRKLCFMNRTVIVKMQGKLFSIFARDVEPYKERRHENSIG